MSRVVFKDVVKRINVNVDRHNTERLYYVGGEHIDSCELLVTKHGLIEGSTIGFKFHFGFEPGHILFMSRNPHLRKASMATFSGICSDSTYVVETRDENVLLQKYLLLEMQSDRFWEWAEANKSGGVNYLINYKTLDTYEFDLPSLAEQKVLAEKLWAAYEVKQSYLKMIAATEEMVKSQFIEMFDFKDKGLYRTWGELFETQLGKMLDKNKQNPKDTSCQYLANINVQWGFFDMTNLNFMTFKENELLKFELKPNDLLICEGGDAGRCAVWKEGDSKIKYQKAIHRARPIDGTIIDVNYVQYYIQYYKKCGKLYDFITKGTIEHLTGEKLNEVPVFVPPMDQQHQFVLFAQQADKSISELRKSIDAIDKVIRSLINENL